MDDKCFIPKPKSRFVKIQCNACNSSSVIFTMAKSEINCKFCGNILAEPTGGKAKIFGTSLGIVDELSKIIIKTVQKDTKNQVTKLLLDSMIIHQIINNQSIQMFKKKFSNPSKTLIILDRVLIEMIHMEKHVYRVFLTREQIIEKLKEIAPVEIITLDHASEDMVKAKEMYESKKYINDEKIPLSETDCILLLMHLKRVGDLITLDKTLMNAAQKEGLSLTFD